MLTITLLRTLLSLGVISPDRSFAQTLTTFTLSGLVGYHVVWV